MSNKKRKLGYLLLVVSFDAVFGNFQDLLHCIPQGRIQLLKKRYQNMAFGLKYPAILSIGR